MDLITDVRLMGFTNALYVQFMTDVNEAIKAATPEALMITKCYNEFSAARATLDESFVTQRKNNLTDDLAAQDELRDRYYRCFKMHVEADLYNSDADKTKKAQRVWNKISSYSNMLKLGRRAESAEMEDMGRALQDELSSEISDLGQEDNLNAMIEANNAYIALSQERSKSKQQTETNATRNARLALDDAYRNLVTAVNVQIQMKELVDNQNSSDGGSNEDGGPAVQSADSQDDVLAQFVNNINVLIEEYKTTAAQSGSHSSGSGTTDEPDDLPVVQ